MVAHENSTCAGVPGGLSRAGAGTLAVENKRAATACLLTGMAGKSVCALPAAANLQTIPAALYAYKQNAIAKRQRQRKKENGAKEKDLVPVLALACHHLSMA